jgi:hypothetical protein
MARRTLGVRMATETLFPPHADRPEADALAATGAALTAVAERTRAVGP